MKYPSCSRMLRQFLLLFPVPHENHYSSHCSVMEKTIVYAFPKPNHTPPPASSPSPSSTSPWQTTNTSTGLFSPENIKQNLGHPATRQQIQQPPPPPPLYGFMWFNMGKFSHLSSLVVPLGIVQNPIYIVVNGIIWSASMYYDYNYHPRSVICGCVGVCFGVSVSPASPQNTDIHPHPSSPSSGWEIEKLK